MECPRAASGRALVEGKIYTRKGKLIVSVVSLFLLPLPHFHRSRANFFFKKYRHKRELFVRKTSKKFKSPNYKGERKFRDRCFDHSSRPRKFLESHVFLGKEYRFSLRLTRYNRWKSDYKVTLYSVKPNEHVEEEDDV
jgi:hypothetical protein